MLSREGTVEDTTLRELKTVVWKMEKEKALEPYRFHLSTVKTIMKF